MKIKTDKQTSFTPCSITFTFETQEELDTMFKLFNWTPVTHLNSSFSRAWREIDALGVHTSGTAEEAILRHPGIRNKIVLLAKEYTAP